MHIEAHSVQDNTAVKRIRQRRGNVYARESPICQLRRIRSKRKRVCTRRPTRHLETCMHEKANTSRKAHSLEARNRVCTRKPALRSRRNPFKQETCMHEKANTSTQGIRLRRGNVYARVRIRRRNAFALARKRVCTGKPTRQLERVRLVEKPYMHKKAITSIQTRSAWVSKRVYTISPRHRNVYARESQHVNWSAFA